MGRYAKEHAEDQIATLAGRGLDLKAFWDESAAAVSSAIPHSGVHCWFFFTHYEPRVRDNERRATQNRPLRGGPMPPEQNVGAGVAPAASVSPSAA